MKLVIIESPAKREALKKYLGDGYEVLPQKGIFATCHKRVLGLTAKITLNQNMKLSLRKKPL